MKRVALLAVTMAVALSISVAAQKSTGDKGAQKGGAAGMKSGGAEQQIKALEDQGIQAALKGDDSWGKAHSTADYTFVDPGGAVSSASSGNMPEPKFTSLEVSEQNIRVYGNTAVVVEKAAVKGTSGTQSIDGDYRLTRVWVKEGGQWKMASGQVTRIAGGM